MYIGRKSQGDFTAEVSNWICGQSPYYGQLSWLNFRVTVIERLYCILLPAPLYPNQEAYSITELNEGLDYLASDPDNQRSGMLRRDLSRASLIMYTRADCCLSCIQAEITISVTNPEKASLYLQSGISAR